MSGQSCSRTTQEAEEGRTTANPRQPGSLLRVSSIPGTVSKHSKIEKALSLIVAPGPLSAVKRGFCVSVATFLPLRFFHDERFAEDIIDLLHSAYAGIWSLRLAASVERVTGYPLVALPDNSKEMAQEFFGRSIGYFLADLCYVLVQLARGHVPHLAAGRLAHHVIQSVANFPAIFGNPAQTSAACTYLSIAYLAEISNMFLRTNNLLKRLGVEKHPLWMANFRTLLTTFFFTRVLNFPLCTLLIWRQRSSLPPVVLRGQLTFAVAGIALNTEWFRRLAIIYRKACRKATAGMELL